MPTTHSSKVLNGVIVRPVSLVLYVLGTIFASLLPIAAPAQSSVKPTTINIAESAKLTNARRLGVNLGTENFWDSGQMMRNIMFRNPGFEGEQWQSILHCKAATATSCTDDNPYTGWPANFLKGAKVEFIQGNAIGTYATVTSMTVANQATGMGVTLNLSGVTIPPSVGDYLVARLEVPGNAQAGWWPTLSSGATLSTEYTDLSPESPGKQALRATVPAGQTATISSYTDGFAGRSFLQLNGSYTLTFRAKSTGGSNNINVSVSRNVTAPPAVSYFNQKVALTTSWKDYSYTFSAYDTGRYGTVQLAFEMQGASVLLDDVALTATAAQDNPTNYRNEVVQALRKLKPGTLRYMDSGTNWGDSIDNMLAPDFAREPAGYNPYTNESDQIAMGLQDFLGLCQAVGTEPWYTMPTGMSVQEMSNLMEYLGGSSSSTYGAKRAAMGQTAPWTSVFKTIHLEFGNEVWNTANPGAGIDDPIAYGKRAGIIFTAAKASSSYAPGSFDFIVNGFEVIPSWNQLVLQYSSNYDTIDVATYIFASFNDSSSVENIYGPMFAEPEMLVDTPAGLMNQHAAIAAAATKPAQLAVYESNISAGDGTASQSAVNSAVPSVGAGITATLNLLLAQRDLGVNNQNLFSLTGYQFNFHGATSNAASTSPIWGSVVDMGGQSNLQRPNFISEQLANSAILPTLLNTSQTGANPTWNQPLSTNDNVVLPGAHYLQSVAYTDGTTLNVIVFNLSRTTALPITFAGLNAPTGPATISTLTGKEITASNETSENVSITSTTQTLQAGSTVMLPPYSMTVISAAAPSIPIKITGMSVACARSTLSPNDSTSCTPTVTGQGDFNSGVTWSTDQGSISSTGQYTAPNTVPSTKKATITATSGQDASKTATFAISIAPNTITGVKVSCSASSVGQGQNTNCSATVSGTGSFSNAYTWTLSGGSITPAGLLTAPLTGTSVTVTAISTQDPTQTASATLKLTQVLTITNPVISTTSSSITASWTTNIASRNGIAYGIAGGSTTGTPYDNNVITNPSYTLTGLTAGATYNLVLTSYTTSQSTSQTISVTVPKTSTPATSTISGVTVSCAASSVLQNGSTNCSAAVSGTGSYLSTVTWSISAGSISTAGVLTAPATGSAITVQATSTQDKTKSGTFAIALTTVLSITNPVIATTSTTITASWSDNVSSRNGVTYGISGGTTSGTPYDANYTTTPSYTLTGLTPGATYNLVLTAYTATQNTTKQITVTLPITTPSAVTAVNILCGASTLPQGGTTTCKAWVDGTGNFSKALNLAAYGGGTVNSAGEVTAPATGTSMLIQATSVQDPTKKATFTISVTSGMAISNPSVTTTSTSITASWKVNTLARNGIAYGITGGSTTGTPYDPNFTESPSYTLTGLTPGATYTLVLTSYNTTQNTTKKIQVTIPKK